MNIFICPQNAVKVARLILELDCVAIEERYCQDSAGVFQQLKALLEQFGRPVKNLNIHALETQLFALIACVNDGLALLTPEAQEQIERAVTPSLRAA